MKYLAALIIPFFIMSCALEKETTDYVNGVFQYTVASVKIDNIMYDGGAPNTKPPVCIDFVNGNYNINYTIISNGIAGNSGVSNLIKDSKLKINFLKLYFNNIPLDVSNQAKDLEIGYNQSQPTKVVISESMLENAGITNGTYSFDIEVVATEFNGNNIHTVSNVTFGSLFGDVIIASNGQGCQ